MDRSSFFNSWIDLTRLTLNELIPKNTHFSELDSELFNKKTTRFFELLHSKEMVRISNNSIELQPSFSSEKISSLLTDTFSSDEKIAISNRLSAFFNVLEGVIIQAPELIFTNPHDFNQDNSLLGHCSSLSNTAIHKMIMSFYTNFISSHPQHTHISDAFFDGLLKSSPHTILDYIIKNPTSASH